MTDITDPVTRSRMMGGIKGKDTKPEMAVRRALHARGFRYRIHDKTLDGKPDIVLPKWHAVVFVHGCFWHQHHGCSNAKMPTSREVFWRKKLDDNRTRDRRQIKNLESQGWRVAVVWECSVRRLLKSSDTTLIDTLVAWLTTSSENLLEL